MRAFDLAAVASIPIYYVVIEDWYDLKSGCCWVCGSVLGQDRYKELLVEPE